MIPVKIDEKDYNYPDFQADQVLTSSHLNHLFNFLDLQERLTRTNLIGIGIVCGLKATKSSDGKTITITKGTGVTSQGYLIVHGIEDSDEPVNYKKYRNLDALKDKTYDVFVSGSTQKYALWELIDKDHEDTGDKDLDNYFLTDKVCLLFYEILNEQAKNCDPTSCDDKGVKVFINIRKLLITISDALTIINTLNAKAKASGSGEVFPGIFDLPEIKLPRFDVLATKLETTGDVYAAYQKIFTKEFIGRTGTALNKAFDTFKDYLQGISNPFLNFITKFAYLYNGTIQGNSLLNFQYYYDFFYDLLMAYDEWRESAHRLMGMCTPPEALFPRHLFLGTLDNMDDINKSIYRNYFIPSPIHTHCANSYNEFLALFRRIDRLNMNLKIPYPLTSGNANSDSNIRITPSVTGTYSLGDRAIPYYYMPNETNNSLIKVWNPDLTSKGNELHILTYNPSYNTSDDFVKNPLKYDLEPYNFFRIEGHIGKKYYSALASIQSIRDNNRLPFNMLAVSADSLPGTIDLSKFPCYFNDLEAIYEALRAELLCRLCKIVACIYKVPKQVKGSDVILKKEVLTKSTLEIIKGCKDVLYFSESTLGFIYEKLYPSLIKSKDSGFEIIDVMDQENLLKMMSTAKIKVDVKKAVAIVENDSTAAVFFTKLIILLTQLSETLPVQLSNYDYHKMSIVLKKITTLLQQSQDDNYPALKDLFANNQCLKDIFSLCDLAPYFSIATEYSQRVEKLKQMQSLKQFCIAHPGLQHKGGVPVGGTFVLVYRDLDADSSPTTVDTNILLGDYIVQDIPDIKVKIAAKEKAINNVTQIKYTDKTIAVLNRKIVLMKDKGMLQSEIEDVLGIKLADIPKSNGIFEDPIAKIENGTVIADFYLPYLSSSDCPPIQFVVNIPLPIISFSLATTAYCDEDPAEYNFVANPTGGKIITDQPKAVIDKGEGLFAFLPSKIKIPDGQNSLSLAFTYTKDDQSQTITITLFRKPDVKIIPEPNPNNPLQYTFKLDPPDTVTSATWNFGDNLTSTDISPTHTFQHAGEYITGVEVKNGVCTNKADDVTITVKEPEPVNVDLKYNEVCIDIQADPFTITPAGGTLTGEAFGEKPVNSGKYVFYPPKVNMIGASQKPVTFNYTSPQGATATFNITVFDKPTGISSGDPGILRLYISFNGFKNTTQAVADFGDGKQESYDVSGLDNLTQLHSYAQAGDYIVKTSLVNGPCITLLPDINVTIKSDQPEPKVCPSLNIPLDSYLKIRDSILGSDAFKQSYQVVIAKVEQFFKVLSQELKNNGNVDLSFFDKYSIAPDWIRLLPVTPAAARMVSLQLAIIYIQILTSIACMQAADLSGNTLELFNLLFAKLNEMKTLNAGEKEMLKNLIIDLQSEIDNLVKNVEADSKKNYLSILKTLIELLQKKLVS